MSDYGVEESERFRRDLAALPRGLRGRFESKLGTHLYPHLRRHPHVGPQIRRLQGADPPIWRYRIGDYRFFYAIDEKRRVVSMLTIHHRREAYR